VPSKQVLGGIADTVAQSLTAIRAKSRRNLALGKDISDGIEMPDYDEKSPYATEFLVPHRTSGPPPFDFERLTRFMSYGFIMSPVQFQWFAFLSRAFPITKQSATVPALQRVCFDQLIFAPVGRLPYGRLYARADSGLRSRLLLHVHDRHRGRWPTCSGKEIPRCIPTCAEGEFHALACCPNPQFQSHSFTIPNCK